MINPLCIHCGRASTRPYGGFESACRGCMARRAARSPEFWRSSREGRLTPAYKAMLQGLGVSHEDVKQADADDWKAGKVSA